MATRRVLQIAAIALIPLARTVIAADLQSYVGQVVTAIEFEPQKQPLTYPQLIEILPLKTGEVLRPQDLPDSIQRLYATGEYADIAVDAQLETGGVRLRFITKFNYFVGDVVVEGVPEPPNAGQLETATKLQLGSEYSYGDVRQAVESLNEVLRRNGFYHFSVQPQTVPNEATQQVNILFTVNPGPRAKFDGLTVTGRPLRPLEDVVRSTGWQRFVLGWREVTETRIQSGIDGVRKWYERHNHLLAHVSLTNMNYDPEANRVAPTLNIDPGPEVLVDVEGAKISRGKLRSLLPVYQERSIDNNLVVEGRQDLTDYLKSEGYFDAHVTSTFTENGSEKHIDYQVVRGTRHKLAHIEITGNRYFRTSAIRERMYLIPSEFVRYPRGRYSPQYLSRDVNSIRDLYQSNGFRDVQVHTNVQDHYDGHPNSLAVFIQIDEGPQWFVSDLKFDGVSDSDEVYLRSVLHLVTGQPYSERNLANDRDTVLDYYYDHGYPDARFEFTATAGPKPEEMALVFTVEPGRQQFVRGVLISGLQRTDLDVVTDRLTIHSADPISQVRMNEGQRKLYDLGIFAKVNTAIQDPEGDAPTKNVLYSLEEASRYSFNVGVGAEIARIGGGTTDLSNPAGSTGFSPRLSLGISRLDMFGLGHTLSLQTRVSTLEQRALLTYLAPQIFGDSTLSFQVTGLFDISRDVRTFSARRDEGSVQIAKRLTRANSVQLRYTFRNVQILGQPLVEPELIPLLSQPVRVGFISGTFIQDRRDDPLDAHRGIYDTVDLGLASKVFGSQTGFGRVVARNATYHPLSKNVTFARSIYFGDIERYAGLAQIPLAEEFFSGGSSSHRGFPDNQAGPRDPETGFPIGGNALLINTLELRFPLIGDSIGGVLFNDAGNVYSSLGDISFRYHQRNLQDFNYAVQAFGFGIRYRTPIGPLRLDLAYSPNAPRFFGFSGTYEQLIYGGGQQVVQRINQFQFHFSLGQAF